MLSRFADEDGKDWDKMIPYVLFAYREVPQATTGFSPFELLFGNRPIGCIKGTVGVGRECCELCVKGQKPDVRDGRSREIEFDGRPEKAERMVYDKEARLIESSRWATQFWYCFQHQQASSLLGGKDRIRLLNVSVS